MDVKRVRQHPKTAQALDRIQSLLSENFVWVLVLLVSFIAYLVNPVFYSINNVYNLLMNSVVLGMLVLGETLILLTGNFDNSLEVTLIFSAMVAGWLTIDHQYASGLQLPAVAGLLGMLLVGALVGALNGLFIGYIGMQSFITTFATSVVVSGLGILMTGGSILTPFPDSFTVLGRGMVGKLPLSGIFMIALYLIFHVILRYTYLGRRFYVVGGNREAAQSLGVDVKRTQFIAFVLAGLIAALGGWILGGRLNSASGQMSSGQLLLAFGAAVIGGVKLSGGEAKISGILGGVILIASINTLMNISGISPYVIQASTGFVILAAMLIDAIRSRDFLTARN